MNEKKKILFPSIGAPDEVNCTTIRFFMVNAKQFEKEMKKNKNYFSIVPRVLSCAGNEWEMKSSNDQETCSKKVKKYSRGRVTKEKDSVSWVPTKI